MAYKLTYITEKFALCFVPNLLYKAPALRCCFFVYISKQLSSSCKPKSIKDFILFYASLIYRFLNNMTFQSYTNQRPKLLLITENPNLIHQFKYENILLLSERKSLENKIFNQISFNSRIFIALENDSKYDLSEVYNIHFSEDQLIHAELPDGLLLPCMFFLPASNQYFKEHNFLSLKFHYFLTLLHIIIIIFK